MFQLLWAIIRWISNKNARNKIKQLDKHLVWGTDCHLNLGNSFGDSFFFREKCYGQGGVHCKTYDLGAQSVYVSIWSGNLYSTTEALLLIEDSAAPFDSIVGECTRWSTSLPTIYPSQPPSHTQTDAPSICAVTFFTWLMEDVAVSMSSLFFRHI